MIKDCEDIVKEICQNIKSAVFWVIKNDKLNQIKPFESALKGTQEETMCNFGDD